MTTEQQPEALRLADIFDLFRSSKDGDPLHFAAADELRRIHAECEAIRAAVATARWYCVAKDGQATLCVDHEDAICEAVKAVLEYPSGAPYKAMRLIDAALASPPEQAAPTMRERLQQKCSDWGTYWRASDAHGVELSHEQAVELLADALGVEVEVAPPLGLSPQRCAGCDIPNGCPEYCKCAPEKAGEPHCDDCGGTGEIFTHADDCRDDLCALNGDEHSCIGRVEPCHCAHAPSAPLAQQQGGQGDDLDEARCGSVTLSGELRALHDLSMTAPDYAGTLLCRRVLAALAAQPPQAPPAGEALAARIAELEAELDDKDAELDQARQAPWPEWAEKILKLCREYSGYDGYDDADGVDLVEEVRGNLAEFAGQIERLKSTQPAAPSVASFTEEHVTYVQRYGGRCRDCADENGVCPNSGLPCGGSEKAIRFVLRALAYGIEHKYLSNPFSVTQPAAPVERCKCGYPMPCSLTVPIGFCKDAAPKTGDAA
jgi:hypothetical protein